MIVRQATLATLLALAAGSVSAQTPTVPAQGFALQTYEPAPAGDDFFAVPGTAAPGHLAPAAAMVLSWSRDPLVLRQDGEVIPGGLVVHRQVWGFAQASLGLGRRVLVDVAAPVALYQSGSAPFAGVGEVSGVAFGDLKLGARVGLGQAGPVALAAALDLWLPTGSKADYMSDGGLRAQPKLLASGAWGPVDCGAELGFLYREARDVGITSTGPAVTFGGAAAWRLGAFRVGPELFGRYQFDGTSTSPLEALLGGHWRRGSLDLGVGVGAGLNLSPGAAPFRALARVAWRPDGAAAREAAAAARAAEQAAAERAAAERRAAEEAERLAASQAAERAEAARLAAQAAAAPATTDRDRDGIFDGVDACPDQAGVPSTEATRHGCPAPAPTPALVKLTRERIEILQAVVFETGQDVIRPESQGLLREVAGVLAAHPELAAVRVEGHTDAAGQAAANTALSARRAVAVKRWLVEQGGIDAGRLQAMGYGSTRPVAPNDTKAGRAQNRRVEFRIVEAR